MCIRDRVTLPPIETQRRIADILSAYDDLIEKMCIRDRVALFFRVSSITGQN